MGEQHLNELMGTVWLVLAASAGLGVVTMAIVQLIKDLLPIRVRWQRRWVETRIKERATETARGCQAHPGRPHQTGVRQQSSSPVQPAH